jgi:hypothetical protein
MDDELRKLLENPALELMAEVIAARARLAGVRLSDEWGPNIPKSDPKRGFDPELIRRLAGG